MKRSILILLFFCFVCMSLHGQQTEIRFHNLGVGDGLSHSLVNSIAEDSLGFIWFGTQDGLNRYDGYEFKTYYKGSDNRSPSDSWITSLYFDRANQLWICYNEVGLERFDPFTETFHPYHADTLIPGSISSTSYVSGAHDMYRHFFEDSDGMLWIGTNRGLNRYNREDDSFEVYLHNPEDPGSLSDNRIITISEDLRGFLWIGTENGLNRMDRQTGEIRRYMPEPNSDFHLNDNSITIAYSCKDSSIWVGTEQGGLNIIENPYSDQIKVTRLIEEPLNPNHEPSVYQHIANFNRKDAG